TYYYVVKSKNDTNGLLSGYSNEVSGIPHKSIGWCDTQWPHSTSVTIGAGNYTENIYGQVWINGLTDPSGQGAGVLAQLGYGPNGDDASGSTWTWLDTTYNGDSGNNDEYRAQIQPE